MTNVAQYGEVPWVRTLGKAFHHLIEDGPTSFFRRVVWRIHYENFQRVRKSRPECNGKSPGALRFLGKEFELHPSMAGLSEELVLFGSHEPLGRQLYLEQLSLGDHVLDIGSNLGYWLLMAEQAIGESGRILGFEPVPEVFNILQRNVARSGHKNIRVLPCAVGATNGTAHFYQSEVPNWGSLMRQDGVKQTCTIDVQVRRLEDVLREFPDFHPNALRMDLEGAELMVLESAKSMLAEHQPSLFVEFHPSVVGWPAIRETLVWLQGLGYSSGTLIQRTWDHPWISDWMRKRRCWSGAIDYLIRRIESPKDPVADYTFSLILQGSRKLPPGDASLGARE